MVRRETDAKVSIARANQIDLNALVRANLEGLLRQMTHDHVIPSIDPKHLERSGKFVPWSKFLTFSEKNQEMRGRLEQLIREITGNEDWHIQGYDIDYPPASLQSLAERSGIPQRRLTQVMYPEKPSESLGNQLTLSEALSLCAATNISIQQLLTPPWWAISKLPHADLAEVEYLKTGSPIPTDRWVSWLYSLEPLPEQQEFLFERNMSHPPPLGPRIDEDGRRVNKNRGIDPYDINDLDMGGLFSEKSWKGELNKLSLFETSKPSETSPSQKDPHFLERHLSAMYWIGGLFVQFRRLLRVARRKGSAKRLDVFWEATTNNIGQMLGRLARLRRHQIAP